MKLRAGCATGVVVLLLVGASSVEAQPVRPRPAVEGTIGQSAFVDEDAIEHLVIGGTYRHYVSPRLSLGPEVQYMVGPGEDRDLFLTANLWLDLGRADPTRRVTTYLVFGGGLMIHHPEFDFLGGPYYEGAATGGLGVRILLGDRWYVAPEARLGWEFHSRLTATVGYRF